MFQFKRIFFICKVLVAQPLMVWNMTVKSLNAYALFHTGLQANHSSIAQDRLFVFVSL